MTAEMKVRVTIIAPGLPKMVLYLSKHYQLFQPQLIRSWTLPEGVLVVGDEEPEWFSAGRFFVVPDGAVYWRDEGSFIAWQDAGGLVRIMTKADQLIVAESE